MSDFLRMEGDARHLRQCVRTSSSSETMTQYGLQFFSKYSDLDAARLEPYLREFGESLIRALGTVDSRLFFPEDVKAIRAFLALVTDKGTGILEPRLRDEVAACAVRAHEAVQDYVNEQPISITQEQSPGIHCLLVEHLPGLEEQGRVLTLHVDVSSGKNGDKSDVISIRNPIQEPENDFVSQVESSVKAARAYLLKRGMKSVASRYRADVALEGATAALTGNSLGLALAAAMVAAITKYEVFRDQYTVAHDVAFIGSVSSTGSIGAVHNAGLKVKLRRAFFSHLRCLAIPRQHLGEAWDYLKSLEVDYPARKLELVGCDDFDAIVDEPRLMPRVRLGLPAYLVAWTARHSRTPKVEIPLLIVLILALFLLIAPKRWMPWCDSNPAIAHFDRRSNELVVWNRDSVMLWPQPIPCNLEMDDNYKILCVDLDGDGRQEVLYSVPTQEECEHRDTVTCLASNGRLLFKLPCAIPNQYPGDSGAVHYSPAELAIVTVGGEKTVVTDVGQSNPGRSHIRFWSASGDSLGWYINAGSSHYWLKKDINNDSLEEAIFLGYNNRMHASALFVLDPRNSYGVSPPYRDSVYNLNWVKHGNQLAYIVFPRTDLGLKDLQNPYNTPLKVLVHQNGLLDVYIGESDDSRKGSEQMIYAVDDRMRVIDCWPTDQFRARRDRLVIEGTLPPINWSEYLINVRNAVLYWADTGWVSEGQLRSSGL